MFPQSWDAARVQTEIESAWANQRQHPKNSDMWIGTSKSGVEIEGYKTPRTTAYRFNNYFGIEGGYTDFGKEKFDWVYSAVESGAGKVNANAFSVAATGRLPVSDNFALLGKLGISRTQIKYREDWSQPGYEEHIRINRTTTVPLIGIGAEYALGKNLSLRAEYEAYGKVKMTRDEDKFKAKTDLISVSLGYHF